MPSLSGIVKPSNGSDMLVLSNQRAQIYALPVMDVAYGVDSTATTITLLKGVPGRAYVIHGYMIYGANTAGTAATGVQLQIKTFRDGVTIMLDCASLTASQVCHEFARQSGLNVVTYPGSDVNLTVDAAPSVKACAVYYSIVDAL